MTRCKHLILKMNQRDTKMGFQAFSNKTVVCDQAKRLKCVQTQTSSSALRVVKGKADRKGFQRR